IATDMMDLAAFLAYTRPKTAGIPTVLYMHENQLTYPLPDALSEGPMRRQLGERDLHYAFINLSSMLAADRVLFNSDFHRAQLLTSLPKMLKHFPDFNELSILEDIAEKSSTVPVGVDLRRLSSSPEHEATLSDADEPPIILWNQRWEYDKNPGQFFDVLYELDRMGIPFRAALCGRNYQQRPSEFDNALEGLSSRIIHSGFADEETYRELLWRSSVVISTAQHEFFGISMIEAIYCQTFSILPNRLSYPEILPNGFHARCLYSSEEELLDKAKWALLNPVIARKTAAELSQSVFRYDWSKIIGNYDELIWELSRNNHGSWEL
ncbi:MAG: DUF3524 domain-containing protein, partial [Candidatus Promineifilaceae bacterium]